MIIFLGNIPPAKSKEELASRKRDALKALKVGICLVFGIPALAFTLAYIGNHIL